jgi:peptidylprolyl isomerase
VEGISNVRKFATIVATTALLAAVAATLTGCTAANATINGCTPAKSGPVSDAVTVSNNFGKTPTVKIKKPVGTVKTTQRTLIKSGTGKLATKSTQITADIAVYNGTTGKELDSTGFDGKTLPLTVDADHVLVGLAKTLQCTRAGSRVVGVIPPSEAFGKTGSTGVGAKDSIVFIADVVTVKPAAAAPLKKATGTVEAPKAGLPTVAFDAKGLPTVTVPSTTAPTALQEEVLIKGKGAKVATDSNVIVNYQLLIWRTGKVVTGNDSYASGQTAPFNTGNVVPGFKQALEGQTIGSRILVVIPPALGYGAAGNPQAGILGTDSVIFLVDILGQG